MGFQPVVDPATALAICQQPRLAQHPEVKGELGLGEVEIFGQITHAAFSIRQSMNHLKANRVGQGLEHWPGLVGAEGVLNHRSCFPQPIWINKI